MPYKDREKQLKYMRDYSKERHRRLKELQKRMNNLEQEVFGKKKKKAKL